VDFLVTIEVSLPHDLPAVERERLVAAEGDRGRALGAAGIVRGIWRVPGRLANVGIWSARDADELHTAITSLPLWPYMRVEVTALATHYLAPACEFTGCATADRVAVPGDGA
jgi:muconolactone D-isomerase